MRQLKILLFFFAAFSTISYAQRLSSYYSQECEVQAGDAKYFATLRDRGMNFNQAAEAIRAQGKYPAEHQEALLAALENTYAMTASSPNQIFSAALHSCQYRGKYPGTKPIVSTGRATGTLSNDLLASCKKLFKQLELDRIAITDYEVQLDQKSKQLDAEESDIERSKKATESDQNVAQLNTRIRSYNTAEKTFHDIRQAYDARAGDFNRKTNQYNKDCGGKGIR